MNIEQTFYVKTVTQDNPMQQSVLLLPSLEGTEITMPIQNMPLVVVVTNALNFNDYVPGDSYTLTLTKDTIAP